MNASDLARSFYEHLNSGDRAALVGLCTDDVEWHEPSYDGRPLGGDYVGPAAVEGLLAALDGAFDRFQAEPEEMIVQDTVVVVRGRALAYARATSRFKTLPFVHVLRFRGDLLQSFEHFTDTAAEALLGPAAR